MSLEARLNGVDLFGQPIEPKASGVVAERFYFPPFSVLDARSGEWQDRKRAWASLGIQGEVGRGLAGDDFLGDGSTRAGNLWHGGKAESTLKVAAVSASGTSIFDPTLCEVLYRWFSQDGGQVVDPFAGGSVRGIVAGMLGRHYWGSDLRAEQIEANRAQAGEIRPDVCPAWVCGDSRVTLADAPPADFVFSCPPYGDLEQYSDDPADLSAMDWPAFVAAYREIVRASVAVLKQDRFAAFVVGDFRDNRGLYRDFVSLTISAFKDAGAALYNEAILVTSVGSASMRVSKQFSSGRKFAKTHQNVLVFVKGDWRRAAASLGEIS